MFKFIILGAGPAGLTFANKLLQNGETDFLVIEKENSAGGLCRSTWVDGSPLDIGGGHFLDVKRTAVLEFLFDFMPSEEWNRYVRNSQIVVNGNTINSPIEANIWQMPLDTQVEYLKAAAVAGCNIGTPMPEKFVEWIYWKFGQKIADDYMIPYNQKMFGINLNSLGTYWLDKLPNVSFDETLVSCLEKRTYGSQPAHAEFFYPKRYGYGELWERMAEKLDGHIIYGQDIETLDINKKEVNHKYQAGCIINTVPWTEFKEISGITEQMNLIVAELRYSSVVIEYHHHNLDTDAQWIYYPALELPYHRILVRPNFCPSSRGYWTETNLDRIAGTDRAKDHFVNKYAYPLNVIGKNEKMQDFLSYMESKNIYGLGRWGEWQHYNSDVVVELAIKLSERLV